jgi:hypothetical protein
MTSADRPGFRANWAQQSALLAILSLACIVPYLLDIGYWLRDLETIVFAAAGVAMSIVLGAAAARWPVLARLLPALLAYVLVDLYFIDSNHWGVRVLLVLLIVPFTRLESSFRWLAGTFALMFLVSVSLSERHPNLSPPMAEKPADAKVDPTLPPVIHLVLDEHGSLSALDEALVPAADAKRLMQDYVDRGFGVFPNTRTASAATQVSISHLMALRPESPQLEANLRPGTEGYTHRVKDNRLLDMLVRRGYQARVVQSNYLRLCAAPDTPGCHGYSRADHGHDMARFSGRAVDRLMLVVSQLHVDMMGVETARALSVYVPVGRWLSRHSILSSKRNYWTRPAAMLGVLDELQASLATDDLRGRAYVAHVMLPHFPYMLDAKCGLEPRARWVVPHFARGKPRPAVADEVVLAAYWTQVRCMHGRSLALIDAVRANPTGKDAIFVIHGDHGVRLAQIQRSPPGEVLEDRDRQLDLETFFVARIDGLAPGIHPEPGILQDRFARILAAGGFAPAPVAAPAANAAQRP